MLHIADQIEGFTSRRAGPSHIGSMKTRRVASVIRMLNRANDPSTKHAGKADYVEHNDCAKGSNYQ